jgi:hypothetical protein
VTIIRETDCEKIENKKTELLIKRLHEVAVRFEGKFFYNLNLVNLFSNG